MSATTSSSSSTGKTKGGDEDLPVILFFIAIGAGAFQLWKTKGKPATMTWLEQNAPSIHDLLTQKATPSLPAGDAGSLPPIAAGDLAAIAAGAVILYLLWRSRRRSRQALLEKPS